MQLNTSPYIQIELSIKSKESNIPVFQTYMLWENHLIMLLYGANIPCEQEELSGIPVGYLYEVDGIVGFFPLEEDSDVIPELKRGTKIPNKENDIKVEDILLYNFHKPKKKKGLKGCNM